MKNLVLIILGTWLACQQPALAAQPDAPTQPSTNAQTLYESSKADLLQIRVLLKDGKTQAAVGSGFLIGQSQLVVTNYHVISQLVMHADQYIAEYVDTNQQHGSVELLAVDVLHDLAVLRVDKHGTGSFDLGSQSPNLSQGEYLYSLGNPLDLGFAIAEGAYNGVIRRSFYDQFLFTGAINAGMSGGPNVTASGQVAGVNVSKRIDGELVSFLVPAQYVRQLVARVQSLPADHQSDFKQQVAKQLLTHQQVVVDNLLAKPLQIRVLGDYQVPIRESEQLRCWGEVESEPEAHYAMSHIRCSMEHAIFLTGRLRAGNISISHQYIKATKMGRLRFAKMQSKSFANERFGSARSRYRTAPMCQEAFVENTALPMRAVMCVRAYREFEGLYDFSLLTITTDQDLAALESRFDMHSVSYDNGLKMTRLLINAIQKAGE